MAKRVTARKETAARKRAEVRGAATGRKTYQKRAAKVVQMDLFAGKRPAVRVPEATAGRPGASGNNGRGRGTPVPRRENAATMAARQRDISVSEFFTKNRHLLGFDNPAKALLTATKEAVDNSLDACEEASILPDLEIVVQELQEDRFRLMVADNGPGILKAQIPKIFGKLLYGSKFHSLKQSRGQQGIGISAAGMYSQITTGKPVEIISRTSKNRPAHRYEITIDTAKNAPHIISEGIVEWNRDHGTKVSMELEGVYKKGRRSLDDYTFQTALANPHTSIYYKTPKGEEFRYERISKELPREPIAIKPHPYGVELGILMRMLKESRSRGIAGAMQSDFSRVSAKVAEEICVAAGLKPSAKPRRLAPGDIEKLYRAIAKVKIMAPPTNCLSPIGAELIENGLTKAVQADFHASVTRSPAVYRGNPFQIEVGLAYGGDLPADALVDLWRYANRVPLQYQQSACAITRSAISTDWRKYGLQQGRGALPIGPMVLFAHMASVWVPFTSESKEAVASYPEIIKEIRLGLQECGRKLGAYMSRKRRLAEAERKKSYIQQYIPHIGIALREILGFSAREEARVVATLKDTLERSRKL
jgi:DNA topoisomerase-6 subunit B